MNRITSEEDACKVAFVMAIKDALNVVSGKWKLAIVCTLLLGPRRFNEMERLLNGPSAQVYGIGQCLQGEYFFDHLLKPGRLASEQFA